MSDLAPLPVPDAARVDDVLSRYRDPVVAAMRAALDRPGVGHLRLMRYHLGWEDAAGHAVAPAGGKMLRPALCLLCCEAAGGDAARAMPAAAALELLHNFTLIHDDIEDSSDTRHGRETLWRVAGVPQAINAGDGMCVLAQRALLRMADAGVEAERVLNAARTLDEACVALCEGQYADIGFETRDRVSLAEYVAMVDGKTASLIGAAMAIGAIAGGADAATVAAFGECGRMLGRAFQIQDDVLGIWGESDVTGKPVADDIRSRKRSFPIAWAFEHLRGDAATALARVYASDALTEADVDTVVSLLNEAGARDVAAVEAARWAEAGIAALRPARLDEERRRDIEALASFVVHRKK
jgi:geranylgeranyl diphosphate synthase type I